MLKQKRYTAVVLLVLALIATVFYLFPLVLVLTGAMWITYAAIYFLATRVFKRSPQDAAVLTLTVALPNYAALGLPIPSPFPSPADRY